jgi:Mrp family chromosome partitioning ATPase
VGGTASGPFADVLEVHNTSTIVGKAPSSVTPAAVILLVGVLLGLAGAVLVDQLDHSIRTEKSAASAFAAPVLCAIPPRRRGQGEYATFGDLGTPRREAYRALAATAVATDRLPNAIMVSTPQGDAHEDVAANFASALAGLGLRVALVATSPDQRWFGEPFTAPSRGAATLPELLTMAHSGELNGQVRQFLPRTDLNPNLLLVPPADDRADSLPLDGLPPLLDALARAGVDITVIAGPPVLEDADAIIIAWATRSVLWAVQAGELTQDEARAATHRLELAGVSSFGVAMLDPETS